MTRKIILSVKRSQFRCDDPTSDEADAGFKKVRPEIIERDDKTCQFCDFRAPKYQEVHHLNDIHSDNSPENLVTACCLCHAAHHVGLSGTLKRGCLIYLDPALGITQADLNQIVRAQWIGENSKSPEISMSCISMLSRLHKANVPARRRIGSSDLSVLSDFLLALDEEKYSEREKYLEGIYFLPFKEYYKAHIDYWMKDVYGQYKPTAWVEATEKKLARWSEDLNGSSRESDIAKILRDRS
jgi:intracellular multiplication protein IcmJ